MTVWRRCGWPREARNSKQGVPSEVLAKWQCPTNVAGMMLSGMMLSGTITSVARRHCFYQGGGAGRSKKLIVVLFSTWFNFNGGYRRPLLYLANEELQAPWTSVRTDVDTVIWETSREEYPSCKLMETSRSKGTKKLVSQRPTSPPHLAAVVFCCGYLQGISDIYQHLGTASWAYTSGQNIPHLAAGNLYISFTTGGVTCQESQTSSLPPYSS